MSVNKVNKQTGELVTLANGTRMWIGTQSAHDAAVAAGTMPNNCMVCITDDYKATSPEPDWENIHLFTSAELSSGYTCPSNGQICIEVSGSAASVSINGHEILAYSGASVTQVVAVTSMVAEGDVIRASNASPASGSMYRTSFVPFKEA